MTRLPGATAAAVLALAACRTLPEIPPNTCGNHVIEEGEDCDGFSMLGSECVPPGGPGECHLDCSTNDDGPGLCPEGFGCDRDRVCRRPLGTFAATAAAIPGAALTLSSGDFDGDGRADIVSRSVSGYYGLTQVNVHFFDANAAPLTAWTTTQLLGSVAVASLSPDSRSDLLFSQSAVGALLGESNRTLSPDAYPSYYVEGGDVLVLSVHDRPVDGSAALAVIRQAGAGFEIERPAEVRGERLVPVATLGDGADVLAAEPTTGRLFENAAEAPCQELALALYGASELLLYQLCEEREGLVVWRDEPRVTTLAFRPATVASAAPLFADLDGNGYNDVLVATPLGTYAAYGDGTELGPLNPLSVLVEGQRLPVPPVAAGDFSGDGIADLIVPYALLVSQRLEGEISYRTAQPAYRGPWARGLVADLNADGRLDAVTASNVNPGIEFFMGLGDGRQNPFVIPTTSAAERLRTGDFDGDGVFDLAFVMPSQGPAGDDQIAIAFGNPVGAPDAPVPVAHVSGITELVELSENDHEISTDLLVVNNFGDPASDTEHHSALSLLLGSGDRRFFSPILLTTFAMDASLEQAESMAVTSGDFDGDGKVDVAAIGMNAAPLVAGLDIVFSLWLLPDFSSGMSAPRRLEWSFDPRILPVIPDPEFAPLAVRFSAADLDADGADELLIAAPIEGGSRCVLAWAGLANEGSTLGREQQIVFDASCSFEPPFEVRDLDGDGARDLVIAVGRDENLGLDVLWNDGSGRFSLERSTRIEDPNGILAFTTYERSSGGPALAYTSVQEVSWLDANADRTFSELGKLGGFQFATGITAGDIDGDGVIDLAVADAGSVRVLKAELAQQ